MKTIKTIKTGLIGYPVGHSLSPLIHNHWIKQYGLNSTYSAHEILPEHLKEGIFHLIEEGYTGFNITLPHKQTIINLCDTLDNTAKAIGAVNTIIVKETGIVCGSNTDTYGFLQNIKQSHPAFDFTSGSALILGAGGAARAIAYGLQQEAVPEINITNRTQEKAERLAADFALNLYEWNKREDALKNINLLINTTSLGMTGQAALTLDLSHLPRQALVCDIVYSPLQTNLLKRAEERGNDTVTGLGMLLHQARPAFHTWFDIMPAVTKNLQNSVMEQLHGHRLS